MWNAEKIVDERVRVIRKRKVRQFCIKWVGFGEDHNTWEPRKNLLDKVLLEEWRLENPLRNKKRKRSSRPTASQAKSKKQENTNKATGEKLNQNPPQPPLPPIYVDIIKVEDNNVEVEVIEFLK